MDGWIIKIMCTVLYLAGGLEMTYVTLKLECSFSNASNVDLSKISSIVSFAKIRLSFVLSSGFFNTSLMTYLDIIK